MTDESESKYIDRFYDFFLNFRSRDGFKYRNRIKILPDKEDKVLYIDFNDLVIHDGELAVELSKNPKELLKAAREDADIAVSLGENYGYRNAQVTVLAPTGTISIIAGLDSSPLLNNSFFQLYNSLSIL